MKEPVFRNMGRLLCLLALFCLTGPDHTWAQRDALGRDIRLEGPPGRIIPLAPSLTEILYFLGLGDRVAGVTLYSNYPPEVALKPRVGAYTNLNVERIITLDPDLVIGTVDGNKPGAVAMLEQAGIPVFLVNPRGVREVIRTVAEIGRLCGLGDRAEALSEGLTVRLERVLKKIGTGRRPLVFFQINIRPIMTVNRNTFHNDLIVLAGGRNMAGDEPITYPRISLEEVIRRRPEVIFLSSMARGGGFEEARREWFRWKSIPAVQQKRVHLIDSNLTDRPSPRLIDGLEKMARLIHPEVDWE